MTSIWLSFKAWAALVVLGLVAVICAQQVRIEHARAETFEVRQEFADARTKAAQEAQAAEAAARTEEARREAINQEIRNDAKRQTEAGLVAARDSDAAAAGLRKRLDAYVAASRRCTANTSTAGRSAPAAPAANLLADLYLKADQRAGELSSYADAARNAGQACERYADSLQPQ